MGKVLVVAALVAPIGVVIVDGPRSIPHRSTFSHGSNGSIDSDRRQSNVTLPPPSPAHIYYTPLRTPALAPDMNLFCAGFAACVEHVLFCG